ncbi:MAG: hypothetical protein HY909_30015 [Deltaproteobacteria bacterium]|nr:hypothetical protein [Deltaproteobacteria bacterium]
MRHLGRIALPRRVLDALRAYQNRLDRELASLRRTGAPELVAITEGAWERHRSTKAVTAVVLALDAMASGRARCMYCEDSRGCDVEHFRPKARFPGHTFTWMNLLKVCTDCNRQKDAAFNAQLLDPTVLDPYDHLLLTFSTGRYRARQGSSRGAATLRILPRLNHAQVLQEGRRDAWVKLKELLSRFDQLTEAGDHARASSLRQVIVRLPFSGVFAAALRASEEPGAATVLGADFMAVLKRRPELRRWLQDEDKARATQADPGIQDAARRIRLRR